MSKMNQSMLNYVCRGSSEWIQVHHLTRVSLSVSFRTGFSLKKFIEQIQYFLIRNQRVFVMDFNLNVTLSTYNVYNAVLLSDDQIKLRNWHWIYETTSQILLKLQTYSFPISILSQNTTRIKLFFHGSEIDEN